WQCNIAQPLSKLPRNRPICRVAACRMRGSTSSTLFTPEKWIFENSLSRSYGYVPSHQKEHGLTFAGTEEGLDVYQSKLEGKKHSVARVKIDPNKPSRSKD